MLVSAGDARVVWLLGEPLEIRLTAEETDGALGVVVDRGSPGFGPPPHVHSREDETFYVVAGEYEFDVDGQVVRASRGDLVHARRGRRHSYRNVGDAPGELLTFYAPGGLEGLFLEAGAAAPGPPDPSALLALAPRFGVEFLVGD